MSYPRNNNNNNNNTTQPQPHVQPPRDKFYGNMAYQEQREGPFPYSPPRHDDNVNSQRFAEP